MTDENRVDLPTTFVWLDESYRPIGPAITAYLDAMRAGDLCCSTAHRHRGHRRRGRHLPAMFGTAGPITTDHHRSPRKSKP